MNNKVKSIICLVLSIIISVGVPIIVTLNKFKLVTFLKEQKPSVRVSIIAAIIVLILFAIFFKKLINYFNKLDFSFLTQILKGLIKLIPLICVMLILVNIVKVIDNLIFVSGWVLGCNAVSLLILDPLTAKFAYEYNLDKQRKIIKEGINNVK